MKSALSMVCGLAFVLALVVTVKAADDKEKTIKGMITCAKCDLKLEGQKKCATVVKAKEGDKDVIYFFDAAANKKHHGEICQTCKEGTVTGKVEEKDGKKVVTVTKVAFKE